MSGIRRPTFAEIPRPAAPAPAQPAPAHIVNKLLELLEDFEKENKISLGMGDKVSKNNLLQPLAKMILDFGLEKFNALDKKNQQFLVVGYCMAQKNDSLKYLNENFMKLLQDPKSLNTEANNFFKRALAEFKKQMDGLSKTPSPSPAQAKEKQELEGPTSILLKLFQRLLSPKPTPENKKVMSEEEKEEKSLQLGTELYRTAITLSLVNSFGMDPRKGGDFMHTTINVLKPLAGGENIAAETAAYGTKGSVAEETKTQAEEDKDEQTPAQETKEEEKHITPSFMNTKFRPPTAGGA